MAHEHNIGHFLSVSAIFNSQLHGTSYTTAV